MAYDDNGNYYFNPELDDEDADALRQVDRLEQARNYKAMKNAQAYEVNLSKNLLDEALKEADLTQAEYQRLFYEDPETSKSLLGEAMKHVTKNLAARKKTKPQEPKAKPQAPKRRAEPEEREQNPNEIVQAAREKVNRGSGLTMDEELKVIEAVVGRMY